MSRFLFHFLPLLLCAVTLCAQSPTPSPTASTTPEKNAKLQTLKGDFILGTVELRDDYTLSVTSESGIMNIPIAMLNAAGFKKYGLQKDRSKDGRLWSERKDALETAEKDGAQKPDAEKNSSQTFEIQLAEIVPFQPYIDTYQKSVEDKKSADAASSAQKTSESGATGKNNGDASMNLFSNPTQATKALDSLSSAASGVMGGATSLPAAPTSLPGVPTSIPASLPVAP